MAPISDGHGLNRSSPHQTIWGLRTDEREPKFGYFRWQLLGRISVLGGGFALVAAEQTCQILTLIFSACSSEMTLLTCSANGQASPCSLPLILRAGNDKFLEIRASEMRGNVASGRCASTNCRWRP
jgi:hypothetical protein